jgi:hypothetical protein
MKSVYHLGKVLEEDVKPSADGDVRFKPEDVGKWCFVHDGVVVGLFMSEQDLWDAFIRYRYTVSTR